MKNSPMLLMALSTLAMTVGACRNEGAKPSVPEDHATMTPQSAPQAASQSYDLEFIDTMTQHHMAAIEMANMAQGKVRHTELKDLVQSIPQDQQAEINRMKEWRDQWYPGATASGTRPMPGMESSKPMDTGHLRSMPAGDGYDAMFIQMMVPHHEAAIRMAKEALDKAQHPEIKALAQEIINAQQREIDTMGKLK
ncbi:MAG: DUF305 domain-containing protein [Thermoanaerobaculia bacterium]